MKKELDIKHVLPYLPYDLQMKFIIRGEVVYTGVLTNVSHRSYETHPTKLSLDYHDSEHIWMFRRILKPMSELNREDCIYLNIHIEADKEYVMSSPLNSDYDTIQYLLSKHYDIFNLIEAGLADSV